MKAEGLVAMVRSVARAMKRGVTGLAASDPETWSTYHIRFVCPHVYFRQWLLEVRWVCWDVSFHTHKGRGTWCIWKKKIECHVTRFFLFSEITFSSVAYNERSSIVQSNMIFYGRKRVVIQLKIDSVYRFIWRQRPPSIEHWGSTLFMTRSSYRAGSPLFSNCRTIKSTESS